MSRLFGAPINAEHIVLLVVSDSQIWQSLSAKCQSSETWTVTNIQGFITTAINFTSNFMQKIYFYLNTLLTASLFCTDIVWAKYFCQSHDSRMVRKLNNRIFLEKLFI